MNLDETAVILASTLIPAVVLVVYFACGNGRSADEVAKELSDQKERKCADNVQLERVITGDSARGVAKVLHELSTELYQRQRLRLWLGVGLLVSGVWVFGDGLSKSTIIIPAVLCVAVGVLIQKVLRRRAKTIVLGDISFHLPIVMERIVMAVEAGLDVLPAMKRIVDLSFEAGRGKNYQSSAQVDPVTRLLSVVVSLVEAGLSFEDALREVGKAVESPAFKHAFVHLAVAHREGGELVAPLRELSDATQLYYQETIEEEIATLPVRATLPLLCTFAGLILFFITAPLMQVLGLMSSAMPR